MTCEKITYLIEKGYLTQLNISEKVQVKLHSLYCKCCTNYPNDSLAINRMLSKLKDQEAIDKLSFEEKEELKEVLKNINT